MKASQELYELRIAEYGEDDKFSIIAGKIYAMNLQDANRGEEARNKIACHEQASSRPPPQYNKGR